MFYLVHQEILAAVADPERALVIASVGAGGICWEFLRPGTVAPGVAGATLVLLCAETLSHSLRDSGLAFLTLAIGLLLTGALVSRRILSVFLSISGVVALFGSLAVLKDVGWGAVCFAGSILGFAGGFLLPVAVRARRNKINSADRNDINSHSGYAMGRQS